MITLGRKYNIGRYRNIYIDIYAIYSFQMKEKSVRSVKVRKSFKADIEFVCGEREQKEHSRNTKFMEIGMSHITLLGQRTEQFS